MSEKKLVEKKPKKRNFMSRNVTEFRHFLVKGSPTESDLNWVINLREDVVVPKSEVANCSPPGVYFKKTELTNIRSDNKLKQEHRFFHANQYDHMILKNTGNPHQTEEQLNFYAQLRSEFQRKLTTDSSKNFDTLPYKDRKQLPTFIKHGCAKKLKLTDNDKELALDGAHKQDPYTEKVLRTKNYGFLQSFTKMHGRSHVSLPSLAWQVGLRNYR